MEKEFVTVYYEIADSYLENLSYTYYVDNDSLSLERLKIADISQIKGFENLTNLKRLYLTNNKIKEIKGLDNLTKLEILCLGYNQIEEIKVLGNLTNLKKLYLPYNNVSTIEGLENLANLIFVDLEDNPVTTVKNPDELELHTELFFWLYNTPLGWGNHYYEEDVRFFLSAQDVTALSRGEAISYEH